MNQNEVLTNHIDGLTKQLSIANQKIEIFEERLNYYEDVLATLIIALKDGGVIVQEDDGEHSMPS